MLEDYVLGVVMPEQDLRRIMRPLYKDKIEAAREKQRRRRFADYNLPNTSQDWSDDQIHAYKGMRDGLGMDAHRAEQYVNSHTPPSKPSGRANIFYPAMEPTAFEQDLTHQVGNRQRPLAFKPDDGPPVQFSSQSGHVLGDGEARKPRPAPVKARPIFNEAATIGRQVHNREQADRIAKKNGIQNSEEINRPALEKPSYVEVRRDPVTKKRIVTAKFGDKAFEFNRVYTADEITGGMASIKAKLRSNPRAMGMERVEGVSGEYYINPDDRPEGYKAARDKATSVRFAKDANKATTYGSVVFPALGLPGAALSGYVAYQDPTDENIVDVGLSAAGHLPFRMLGLGDDAAKRASALMQLLRGEITKDGK